MRMPTTKTTLIVTATAALLLTACGDGGSTDAAGGGSADDMALTPDCPDPDGQLAQDARDEGEVVMTGTPDGTVRTDVPAAFEEAYGVRVDYIGGRNSEIAARLRSEREAGVYTHDVFAGGGNTMSNTYYGEEWLASLRDVLDPALLEPGNWRGGGPKWVDPEQSTILQLSNYVDSGVVVNTDEVEEGELESYEDLLDPQWRGKIVSDDPRGSGGAIYDVGALEQALGRDFVEALYVDQEPTLLTDHRQALDDIARGRYVIGLSLQNAATVEAVADGLPVEEIELEGAPPVITGGTSQLALNNRAPHPNAAALLVNWLVCRQGSSVWMNALQLPSARADVPVPEGLEATLPEEGGQYYDSSNWEVLTQDVARLEDMMVELLGPQ